MRIHALYNRSRRVLALLISVVLASVIIGCVSVRNYSHCKFSILVETVQWAILTGKEVHRAIDYSLPMGCPASVSHDAWVASLSIIVVAPLTGNIFTGHVPPEQWVCNTVNQLILYAEIHIILDMPLHGVECLFLTPWFFWWQSTNPFSSARQVVWACSYWCCVMVRYSILGIIVSYWDRS
jgi:hypothetical protein